MTGTPLVAGAPQNHFWRGFGVGLALYLGLPFALALFSMVLPALAVLFAFVVWPILVYAYPFMALMPESTAIFPLTLLSAAALGAVFGFCVRKREDTGDQWLLALAAFAGWWLLCRLALLIADVHPKIDVRM